MPVEMFDKDHMETAVNRNVNKPVKTEALVWCAEKVELYVNCITSQEF